VLESKKSWTKKIRPGVSTFGTNTKNVGPAHLKELFDHAIDVIPKKSIKETPLFLLATAGVRLLPDDQRNGLLKEICSYAQKTDFMVPDCNLHIQAISGETEGLYGWTAANYLLGGFDSPEEHNHGKGHHTYGFLDMGGASAQIAFAPNATETQKHANDLQLMRLRTVDGVQQEYRVFVTTWLGFGANEARRRYTESLIERQGGKGITIIHDPCLPTGATTFSIDEDLSVTEKNPQLIGAGDFRQCLKDTFPLLDKDAPCEDAPCLVNGVHVPAIDFDVNHFVGVSEYWHTTHEVFEAEHSDKAYDFNTYQKRVNEFCSKDWTTIQDGVANAVWGKKVTEQSAREVCFKASWLINILHEGIGIPRVGFENTPTGHNGTKEVLDGVTEKGFSEAFRPYDKIAGTDVSWTLGKMVLYAASQVPPTESDSLPVGFGANVKGIPKDFQYAGQYKLSVDENKTKEGSLHRISGLFLILLTIGAIFLCLIGRDRRKRYFRRFSSFINRGKRRKLLNSNGFVTYERVHQSTVDVDDVELGEVDSDNSDSGDKQVHSSGIRTPTLQNGSNGFGSKSRPSLTALDRNGLVSRTESRERLTAGFGMVGKRSRPGSPSRSRTPLASMFNVEK
jgi:Golgi apyrase